MSPTQQKNIFLIILGLFFIVGIGVAIFFTSGRNIKDNHVATFISKEEIIDFTSIPEKVGGHRNSLLRNMIDPEYTIYNNYPELYTYFLDDEDSSSEVIIGTYGSDSSGENGGILMLKPLPNGKYSIYWEITSPMFSPYNDSRIELRDINNDGLKELITYWGDGRNNGQNFNITHYWIFSLDSKNKTYRVINPIVDKDKNLITNYDFITLSPVGHFNRFQINSFAFDIAQDLDNDEISEIIINRPGLETASAVNSSSEMTGKDSYSQIYKWDGSKYYLWKESTDLAGKKPIYIMKREEKELEFLSASTEYPEIQGLSNQKIQTKVNEEIKQIAQIPFWLSNTDYIDPDCKTDNASASCQSTYSMGGMVSEITSKYISIHLGVFAYSAGAAHPNHYGSSFNYDLENDKKLSLHDFFKPNVDYLSVLSKKIRADLAIRLEIEGPDEMLDEGTGPDESNFSEFVLTDKGFLFMFADYAVAPYVAGNPSSLILYKDLNDILDPEFVSQIKNFKPSPLL